MPHRLPGRIRAAVNGFEEDTTLAAVETWADTVEALGGQSA